MLSIAAEFILWYEKTDGKGIGRRPEDGFSRRTRKLGQKLATARNCLEWLDYMGFQRGFRLMIAPWADSLAHRPSEMCAPFRIAKRKMDRVARLCRAAGMDA
jgi:hypothetical protein